MKSSYTFCSFSAFCQVSNRNKLFFLENSHPSHYSKSQIYVQKFNFDNIFTSFSPKFFLAIFLVKSKLSTTAKKSKTTKFLRVFHPKKVDNFLRKSKAILFCIFRTSYSSILLYRFFKNRITPIFDIFDRNSKGGPRISCHDAMLSSSTASAVSAVALLYLHLMLSLCRKRVRCGLLGLVACSLLATQVRS